MTTRALGILGAFWRRKVLEGTEQIAIWICRGKRVKTPRVGLRCGDQFRFAVAPQSVQIINFLFAFQIQPSQHCPMLPYSFR
jgi:hypothetical protein